MTFLCCLYYYSMDDNYKLQLINLFDLVPPLGGQGVTSGTY